MGLKCEKLSVVGDCLDAKLSEIDRSNDAIRQRQKESSQAENYGIARDVAEFLVKRPVSFSK